MHDTCLCARGRARPAPHEVEFPISGVVRWRAGNRRVVSGRGRGHRMTLSGEPRAALSNGVIRKTARRLSTLPAWRGTGGSFSRPVAFAPTLLSADIDAVVAAEWGRRTRGRAAQRSGYRHRDLETRLRAIDVAIPKSREGTAFPSGWLERRKCAGSPLITVVGQSCSGGHEPQSDIAGRNSDHRGHAGGHRRARERRSAPEPPGQQSRP